METGKMDSVSYNSTQQKGFRGYGENAVKLT